MFCMALFKLLHNTYFNSRNFTTETASSRRLNRLYNKLLDYFFIYGTNN
jgi:hypothetical protein